MRVYILFCLIFAMGEMATCARVDKQDGQIENRENSALYLIEKFIQEGMSIGEVKKHLGKPQKTLIFKDTPDETAYYYRRKSDNSHKWGFGVNKLNQVIWLHYSPWGNPLLDRVEILPETLKKYNCKKKSEPDNSTPDLIQNHTFFECTNDKIKFRAYYNRYGEIRSIAANR